MMTVMMTMMMRTMMMLLMMMMMVMLKQGSKTKLPCGLHPPHGVLRPAPLIGGSLGSSITRRTTMAPICRVCRSLLKLVCGHGSAL